MYAREILAGPAGPAPEARARLTALREYGVVEQAGPRLDARLARLHLEPDDEAFVRTFCAVSSDALGADRCSVFFVHPTTGEVVSRSPERLSSVIRLAPGAGLAGHVARTGEWLNITDASADPRFDRGVDERSGYRTVTMLVLPVLHADGRDVFAVVEALNKRDGVFERGDQMLLERLVRAAAPRLERIHAADLVASRG